MPPTRKSPSSSRGIREGWNDPIDNAHSQQTKVPPRAMIPYILHYTEPGDIILEPFCGSGMRHAAKAKRDVAAVRLLYDLALRRGTVVALDVARVDLEAGTIAVVTKGRTEAERRTLPEPTQAALRDWLAARGAEPGPLFLNFDRAGKGRRLTGSSLYRVVRDLGLATGQQARPHGLRHAAITEALDLTGGDVRAVARFSGHRKLETLMVYDDNRRDLGGEVAAVVISQEQIGSRAWHAFNALVNSLSMTVPIRRNYPYVCDSWFLTVIMGTFATQTGTQTQRPAMDHGFVSSSSLEFVEEVSRLLADKSPWDRRGVTIIKQLVQNANDARVMERHVGPSLALGNAADDGHLEPGNPVHDRQRPVDARRRTEPFPPWHQQPSR